MEMTDSASLPVPSDGNNSGVKRVLGKVVRMGGEMAEGAAESVKLAINVVKFVRKAHDDMSTNNRISLENNGKAIDAIAEISKRLKDDENLMGCVKSIKSLGSDGSTSARIGYGVDALILIAGGAGLYKLKKDLIA